jgi:3-oxoacyl-[acyl-carrier protein] reductase
MKVAAYQAPLLPGGSMEAINLIAQQVKSCESAGVEILCCPEAVLGGLADNASRSVVPAIDVASGQLRAVLAPLASGTVTTIVGFTESGPEGHLFNSAAVFSRGEVVGVYRKIHPAINRSVYEPGTASPIFEAAGLVFGVVICRDSTFPELARRMASRGATALFVPTNNALAPAKGGAEVVDLAWRTDVSRARENGMSVIRADVAGRADGLESYGSSGIVDHDGLILLAARRLEPDLLIAELQVTVRTRNSEPETGTEPGTQIREPETVRYTPPVNLGLKGRVAVVTGASKGIGRAIARGLADEGMAVVLMARDADAIHRAADEIGRATGGRTIGMAVDVRDGRTVDDAAAAVRREFGTVHVLVNNAGGPIKRQDIQITWPEEDWLDDINTKTMGMLRMTKAFLPILARDGSGRIVNVSGIAGSSVLGRALTHGLNNSAMNQVTTYLARDLAPERITVNSIIPGLIATEWRETWADASAAQQGQTRGQFLDETCRAWGIVSGRWGRMDEVADLAVFLASDRASYITGARVPVDGGYTINAR